MENININNALNFGQFTAAEFENMQAGICSYMDINSSAFLSVGIEAKTSQCIITVAGGLLPMQYFIAPESFTEVVNRLPEFLEIDLENPKLKALGFLNGVKLKKNVKAVV